MKLQKKSLIKSNQKSTLNLKNKTNIFIVCTMIISLVIITFYLFKNQIRPNYLEKTVVSSKRYQSKLKRLKAKSLKKGAIILFGDSVLESLSFENNNIYNYSIGGETIGLLKKRITEREYPDSCSVIIMIGLNNFLFNMSPKKTYEEYQSLIDLTTSKLSFHTIILLELLPISANSFFVDKDEINLLIQEFNIQIRSLVKNDVSGKIYFIPLYGQFKDHNNNLKTTYTYDGIHLNANGGDLLKDNILSFLYNERVQ